MARRSGAFQAAPRGAARRRVLRILSRVASIPRGHVRTYGDIDPRAPRLVGSVLARHGDTVPWQRVVRADGTVPMGIAQLALLRIEKVRLRGNRVILAKARVRIDRQANGVRAPGRRAENPVAPAREPTGRRFGHRRLESRR